MHLFEQNFKGMSASKHQTRIINIYVNRKKKKKKKINLRKNLIISENGAPCA